MKILSVDVFNLRNIQSARLELSPHHNLLFGANGAGKTSLLEAVHLLGYGRSFRTRNPRELIGAGNDQRLAVSALFARDSGEQKRAGISKSSDGQSVAKLDGEVLPSASELVREFPLVSIEATSVELLTGGPSGRRQALDWGVFHVEHGYADLSRQLRRVLLNRNALLKRKASSDELAGWDEQLVRLSESTQALRQPYFEALMPCLVEVFALLEPELAGSLQAELYPGWPVDKPLEEVLAGRRDRDLFEKRTTRGAHAADIRFTCQDAPVRDRFSRGQLKALLIAFKCAQAKLYNVQSGRQSVLLLDDLAAELDPEKLKRVVGMLDQLGCQTLQTYTAEVSPQVLGLRADQARMFHVEQGKITQLPPVGEAE